MSASMGSKAIYLELLKEINQGKYKPLGRLPSEMFLARRYNVSRGTVRRAKKMLEEAGLINASRGSGACETGSTGLEWCAPRSLSWKRRRMTSQG